MKTWKKSGRRNRFGKGFNARFKALLLVALAVTIALCATLSSKLAPVMAKNPTAATLNAICETIPLGIATS